MFGKIIKVSIKFINNQITATKITIKKKIQNDEDQLFVQKWKRLVFENQIYVDLSVLIVQKSKK